MKTLWLKVIPALACLLLMSSCSSAPSLSAVLVDVTSCRPDHTGATAELTLKYANENMFALAIETTTGSLYLNNTYIGKFQQNNAIGLVQLGTATSKGTLVIEKPAVYQGILKDAASGNVAYRLVSKMRMEIAEDKTTIKNESTGQLSREQLQAEPAK